ncbi:MAG: hypothetical protein RML40_06350 [Bacteroidota bacterium]|nr:hypothetical protein [Candidatus Kapabacteria bacterium]MDW8220136.1 hypothetical protein [Bacteroidota bacterium]
MLEALQRRYVSEHYTEERYHAFLNDINTTLGITVEFRICEMPLFLSASFARKLEDAAVSILLECVTPEYLERAKPALEDRYTVPHQHPYPLFGIVDFALTKTPNGEYEPKLIELQGFPSLFGFQYVYSIKAIEHFKLDPRLYYILSGKTPEEYVTTLRRVLLNGHDPEHVILMELAPQQQKTLPDFVAIEQLTGVRAVDICSLRKEGRTLLYEREGTWIPIRRIFNRAIIDELDDAQAVLPFDWRDDLDVEWAGHPNWYFLISKYSMPFLKHATVPKTYFLDTLEEIPHDIENYVLKPLFAFAGKGVNVHPTREDVQNVPPNERSRWILQERVQYAEAVYTPEGMNKAEIRILCIWEPDSPRPVPYMSLLRTGRGPMLGARYNRSPWTGASSCFFGDEAIFG